MQQEIRLSRLPDRFGAWLSLSIPRKLLWLVRKVVGIVLASVLFGAAIVAYNYPDATGAVVDGSASVWTLLGPALALWPVLLVVVFASALALIVPTSYVPSGSDGGLRIRW